MAQISTVLPIGMTLEISAKRSKAAVRIVTVPIADLQENAADGAAAGDDELSALHHERMAGFENNVAAVLSA